MNSHGKRSPVRFHGGKPASSSNNNLSFDIQKLRSTCSVVDWDHSLPIPHLTKRTSISILLLAALLCFGNSVYGGVVFDDVEAVERNKDVTGETSISQVFQNDFWGQNITKKESHKSYRPLTILSLRLNHYLAGGLHPFSFHLFNILLQVALSVMSLRMFGILLGHGISDVNQNSTFSCRKAVWLCALLFTVHPIHTENVASLVGRADLLCAVFFCLSLFSYVSCCTHQDSLLHSTFSLFLSLLFCCIAMFCKEQGITVLGICSAYDLIYTGNLSLSWILQTCLPSSKKILHLKKPCQTFTHPKSILIRHVVLFLSGVMLLMWRYIVMGSSPPEFHEVDNPPSFMDSAFYRIINYNFIYALNMWLLLCPYWLCFDWSMGCVPLIESLLDVKLLVVIIFWAGLVGLIIKCAIRDSHQDRALLMGIACLVVPFLPSTNVFFRVGFVIAERNLYLSSFGFCITVVLGINSLCSQLANKHHKVVQFLIGVLLVSYVSKCIHRNAEWREEDTLFKAGLRVCPLNAKIHYNMGKSLADAGDYDAAMSAYREALRLHPDYDQALNNLANLLKESDQPEEAEVLLKKAVSIRPSFPAAWMNLGIVQASLKKYKEAEASYLTALTYRSRYPDCLYNMGNMYINQGMFEDAQRLWELTVREQKDHASAWINIVTLQQETGQYEKGIAVAKEALKHLPNEAHLHFGLGNILGKQGKYKEAEKSFLKAIEIDDKEPSFYANIGVLYHRWQHFTEAARAYKTALDMNPGDHGTWENLQKLQRVMKKSLKRGQ